MVANKVKPTTAMGIHKSPSPSPATPKHDTPKASPKTVFSRSFGVYFPRSSAQVQPRPPDVTELLRIVEELKDRESRFKTELLELKLVKESAAIVPFLEQEISKKNEEIENAGKKIEILETENDRLKEDIDLLQIKIAEDIDLLQLKIAEESRETEMIVEEETKRRNRAEAKLKELEEEVVELRKKLLEGNRVVETKAIVSSESEECSSSQRFQGLIDASSKSNLLKNLKKPVKSTDIVVNQEDQKVEVVDRKKEDDVREEEGPSHGRSTSAEEISKISSSSIRCRAARVPKPPPKRSLSSSSSSSSSSSLAFGSCAPPPPPPPPPSKSTTRTLLAKSVPAPPPPPPSKGLKPTGAKVKRVPEVVEFYQSLMRRDSRRDSGVGVSDASAATNTRDMIGEIENRSAHLLAIKTDVETQGDFIRFLINEVQNASFINIEDVVAFVRWLDDELSYLVDERAVLKHFDWPEQKADALREAAFGYGDLKKLESDTSSFRDDLRQPCGPALKKMQALLEKLEHGVDNLSRMRETSTKKYKKFQIPTDWMVESGFVSQIKLASVKLAMKYLKRVSAELEAGMACPEQEELILQGVRFAFRVHQFAGGFDVETMRAFEELRNKARSCHVQSQNQQLCRSTPC